MDEKKLQPLTLKWLEQQFPNFFERSPNLSLMNTPQTTYEKIMIVGLLGFLAASC